MRGKLNTLFKNFSANGFRIAWGECVGAWAVEWMGAYMYTRFVHDRFLHDRSYDHFQIDNNV